ncbi:class I SAM-dependent methyltransferase [candidate division KSB1 bacterium]|nr:class I SAM-dependent methyltransferase [candidate division KSB1 bacterium]
MMTTNLQPEQYTSKYDQLLQTGGYSTTHVYLLQQIASRSLVLELGPSSGYMTKILAQKDCTVDAIELNPHDAEKAAVYCRKIIVGSLEEDAPFELLDGPYDYVLIADVLEHLRAPEKTLQYLRSQITPTSLVLVSLPNIAYWEMRLALLKGRFDYTDTGLLDRTHLRFYTLKTAAAMFTEAGFRIEYVHITPPIVPRLGRLKEWVKRKWPTLFSVNFIFHLRRHDA